MGRLTTRREDPAGASVGVFISDEASRFEAPDGSVYTYRRRVVRLKGLLLAGACVVTGVSGGWLLLR